MFEINSIMFNNDTIDELNEIMDENKKDVVLLDLEKTMFERLVELVSDTYGPKSDFNKELYDILTFKNGRNISYSLSVDNDLYYIRHDLLNVFINKIIIDVRHRSNEISSKRNGITNNDIIFPADLLKDTDEQIISISKQINASYNIEAYDSCSLMMRRLLQLLMIRLYKKHNVAKRLKNGKYYQTIDGIVADLQEYNPFGLTKYSVKNLDDLAKLCNQSSHGLFDECTKVKIDENKDKFRIIVIELLIAIGIIKFK